MWQFWHNSGCVIMGESSGTLTTLTSLTILRVISYWLYCTIDHGFWWSLNEILSHNNDELRKQERAGGTTWLPAWKLWKIIYTNTSVYRCVVVSVINYLNTPPQLASWWRRMLSIWENFSCFGLIKDLVLMSVTLSSVGTYSGCMIFAFTASRIQWYATLICLVQLLTWSGVMPTACLRVVILWSHIPYMLAKQKQESGLTVQVAHKEARSPRLKALW